MMILKMLKLQCSVVRYTHNGADQPDHHIEAGCSKKVQDRPHLVSVIPDLKRFGRSVKALQSCSVQMMLLSVCEGFK